MEHLGTKDIIYIVALVASVVGTFFATKHNIKEFVRDKLDNLKEKLNDQKIEIEKLKSKDENQQQIIEQLQKQVLDHLPDLFEILKANKQNGTRSRK